MMIKNLIFFTLISLVLFSCGSKKIYESNIEIPETVWKMNHIAKFDVSIEETKTPYNIFINVRNAELYPFNNLWLFITTHSPEGKYQRDTLECILATEKGKWLGDGAGDIWDNKIIFKRNVSFPKAGKYRFEIQHGMRMEDLPLIMEIGLRIENAEK